MDESQCVYHHGDSKPTDQHAAASSNPELSPSSGPCLSFLHRALAPPLPREPGTSLLVCSGHRGRQREPITPPTRLSQPITGHRQHDPPHTPTPPHSPLLRSKLHTRRPRGPAPTSGPVRPSPPTGWRPADWHVSLATHMQRGPSPSSLPSLLSPPPLLLSLMMKRSNHGRIMRSTTSGRGGRRGVTAQRCVDVPLECVPCTANRRGRHTEKPATGQRPEP